MEILKKHLNRGQWFAEKTPKNNICLHHTVSSTANSALSWWNVTPERIATAFLIEKNGDIIEAFPPDQWAHHLGLRHKRNLELNQRSIGIEIVNEGPLLNINGKFRWSFSNANPQGHLYKGEVHSAPAPWKGYRFWAAYTPEQYDSLSSLICKLCIDFDMPPTIFSLDVSKADMSVPDKYTVFSHHHLRPDKSDVHIGFDWNLLKSQVSTKWNLHV